MIQHLITTSAIRLFTRFTMQQPKFVVGSLIFAFSLLSASAHAATVATAEVDRNPVMQDEGFNLVVKVDDDVSRNAFDPAILNKDFVVNRTNVSSQTQIINFKRSQTTSWTTSLIPRDVGRFTIPSFTIEGATTQPITVEVLPVSQNQNAQGNPLFITTELKQSEAWLQQQVQYTIKLHIALDLQRGSLSAPEMRGGEISQVGEDKETSEVINGRRYRVIERTFAIIPQESGEFVIQAPRFEGEVLDSSRRNFGFFNQTRTITKIGKNQTLRVNPIPENYPHPWLPSEHVEIHDEWQGADKSQSLTVGEPVTRTITLTALGVVESQLPEITASYPDTLKTYPDQADTTTVQRNGKFVAQRKESLAIIANSPGEVTLPEIKVAWFNVLTEKTEFVTLPAETFTVRESITDNNSAEPPPIAPAQEQQVTASPVNMQNNAPQWWSLSSWVLLALWLITLAAWWWTRKSQAAAPMQAEAKPSSATESEMWADLQRALKQKNAQNLTNYLQPWLAEICGNPQQSLSKSVEQVRNPQLAQLLTQLFSLRFSAGSGNSAVNSDASELLQQIHAILKQIRSQSLQSAPSTGVQLQPLYPKMP